VVGKGNTLVLWGREMLSNPLPAGFSAGILVMYGTIFTMI